MYDQSVPHACDCFIDPGLNILCFSRAKQAWIFNVGKQASVVRSINEIVRDEHD